jgi:hypothetical protein
MHSICDTTLDTVRHADSWIDETAIDRWVNEGGALNRRSFTPIQALATTRVQVVLIRLRHMKLTVTTNGVIIA